MMRWWFILLLPLSIMAQDSGPLFHLNFEKTEARIIFDEVSRQSGWIFSYSAFNDMMPVTIRLSDANESELFTELSRKCNASFKRKGKYIIVKPAVREDKYFIHTGEITDMESGLPLYEASIYNSTQKIVVNSDPSGSFKIKAKEGTKALKLHIAKENYLDTTVMIYIGEGSELHIQMRRKREDEVISSIDTRPTSPSFADTSGGSGFQSNLSRSIAAHEPSKAFWENIIKKNPNFNNISEKFTTAVAFSLVPPISTNKLLSGNTKNIVAINVLTGYSAGIDAIEVAGLVNFDRGDVRFFQAAGLSNMVQANVYGVQAAGLYNAVSSDMGGVQAAGLFNLTEGKSMGAQIGGLGNYAAVTHGVQAAGLGSITAGRVSGAQLGGLFNFSGGTKGAQIAGLSNMSGRVKGVQISGLFNYADTLTGVQIGLINISKTAKTGLPIGLINIVGNGYHKLELSYEDHGFSSLAFRTGTRLFHTSFIGGLKNSSEKPIVQYGMGFGTSLRTFRKVYLDLEVQLKTVSRFGDVWRNYNPYGQFFAGLQLQIFKNIGLRFGPTFNLARVRNLSGQPDITPDFVPAHAVVTNYGLGDHYQWLGWKASLTLF